MADIVVLQQKIQEYTNWVIEQEQAKNPQFKYQKDLDATYHTWSSKDSWFMEEVSKNKLQDYQEVLNFSLFQPEYAAAFCEQLDTVIPWQLSAEQAEELSAEIAFIDESIAIIKSVLASDYPKLKPGCFEYDQKLAVALWFFCLLDNTNQDSSNHLCFTGENYLNDSEGFLHSVESALNLYESVESREYDQRYSDLLDYELNGNQKQNKIRSESESERKYRSSIHTGGLSLVAVTEDLPGEGTVYDVLKYKRGFCTEKSYTYAYIANRAGLNVGFGTASINSPGQPNHVFNIVYCGKNEDPIKIDLAQKSIDQTYTQETPIDPYQALVGFYEQFSLSLKQDTGIFEQTALLGYAIDPTNPNALNNLAIYYKDKEEIEKAHELYQQSVLYGNAWGINISNAGSFYEINPELGKAQPYYEKAYEIYQAYEDQNGSLEKIEMDDLTNYAVCAYRTGRFEKSLNLYELAIRRNQDKVILSANGHLYAFCLARFGDVRQGHTWIQTCIQHNREHLRKIISDYLVYIDNYLPLSDRFGSRVFAYSQTKLAYDKTGDEYYQTISERLDKTLRYAKFEREPIITGNDLLKTPTQDYYSNFSTLLDFQDNEQGQELIIYYEQQKYFGSHQGLANQMYATALYNRNTNNINPEHYQEALPDLEKAFAAFPMYDLIIAALAYCYVLVGDQAKIEALLETASDHVSNTDVLYAKLGLAYFDAKDYPTATLYFKKALEINPNEAFYYYNCGASLHNSGQAEQAQSYYDRACQLDPKLCK